MMFTSTSNPLSSPVSAIRIFSLLQGWFSILLRSRIHPLLLLRPPVVGEAPQRARSHPCNRRLHHRIRYTDHASVVDKESYFLHTRAPPSKKNFPISCWCFVHRGKRSSLFNTRWKYTTFRDFSNSLVLFYPLSFITQIIRDSYIDAYVCNFCFLI